MSENNNQGIFIVKTKKTKTKTKKNNKKKYFSLDEMIEMMNTPLIKTRLPTIKEELIEPKKLENTQYITPDTLNISHFVHSTSCLANLIIKKWYFLKDKKECVLHYQTYDKDIGDRWYYNQENILQCNLNKLIEDNRMYLQNQLDTYNSILCTINIISSILGDPYITHIEVGWSLQKKEQEKKTVFLKIILDKFNGDNCLVFYKEQTEIMTNEKLLEFVKENSLYFKELKNEIKTFNSIKLLELQEKNKQLLIQKKIDNQLINIELKNKLKQYEKKTRPCSIYINRPLKEIYETISCKKFPEKNEWDFID